MPTLIDYFRLSHYTCVACQRSGVVVRQADVVEVCCPHCGTAAVQTHGGDRPEEVADGRTIA